ncbi:MAG: septum formation protein Maf [Nitrosopumilus sp.]|nr:septum formation protein Maf [Nitrosopumilus sp.]MBA3550706.1 septum formation protein Maf [Patescibacteria group bacterium]
MKIILASSSPGRKKVLEDIGLIFDVVPSDYEEDMSLQLPSHALAMHLSQGKARDVAQKFRHEDVVIIAADTFGVYENNFLGKPHTEEKAKEMLLMLQGNVHSMVTGLTIITTKDNKEVTRSAETRIWFRNIPEEEIDEYIKTGESLEKAGGYAYQGLGNKFVKKIEGSESNIIGLPIEKLKEVLKQFNYQI